MIENVPQSEGDAFTWSAVLQELRQSQAYQVMQLVALRALLPALTAHTNRFSQVELNKMSDHEYKLKITYDVSTVVIMSLLLTSAEFLNSVAALIFVVAVGGRVGLATVLFNGLSITEKSD